MNETAAFGILLAILQASDFHGGLSGLQGKAWCKMKAVVNIMTDVYENGYRSKRLERITQLHLFLRSPNEYNLDFNGGALRLRLAKEVISPTVFGS